ncbi:MAG: Uncharacterised protein [Owenweeksia sp. TMED14]|nr:MAG: Uncharacterised protein [Owenweeksia sp. TMED14]
MQTWAILGHGSVGCALALRLGDKAKHIASRNWISNPFDFSSSIRGVFLAVPDDEIVKFVQVIKNRNYSIPVFHCSGVTPLSAISFYSKSGVWYPLHSFKKTGVPWSNFSVFWEYVDPSLMITLKEFHTDLGIENGVVCSSEIRAKYHLAAVFANNFINHQVTLLQEYCSLNDIDPSIFDKMIMVTIKNALSNSARTMQTGPSHRGDEVTIKSHLNMLPESFKNVYQAMSNSIANFKLNKN